MRVKVWSLLLSKVEQSYLSGDTPHLYPASCPLLWGTVPHKLKFLGFLENRFLNRVSQWESCKRLEGKKEYLREFLPHSSSSLHDSTFLQVIPIVGCDSLFPSNPRKESDFLPVLIPRLPQLFKSNFQFFQYLHKQIPLIKFYYYACHA